MRVCVCVCVIDTSQNTVFVL